MRREAVVVGPSQQRKFRVDISKHEYCASKAETELDQYTIYVYTPAVLTVEKLRAICQQMPEYKPMKTPRPRARDFFDIHLIATQARVDLESEECRALIPPSLPPKTCRWRSSGTLQARENSTGQTDRPCKRQHSARSRGSTFILISSPSERTG